MGSRIWADHMLNLSELHCRSGVTTAGNLGLDGSRGSQMICLSVIGEAEGSDETGNEKDTGSRGKCKPLNGLQVHGCSL